LAIAQALATEPRVLFLDEPTASLDPASVQMIEAILRQTVAESVRVILVTHDAMQAKRLADDIVFVSAGQVVEHASASEFFEAPKTRQARDYLQGRLNV
jgi:tungstate transport system ATP-binding protein